MSATESPSPDSATTPAHWEPSQQGHQTDPTGSASPAQNQFEEQDESQPKGESEPKGESSTSPTPNSSAAASASVSPASAVAATAGDWQAIWSPAHNAYYFYNPKTQETTWTNPLQPAPTPGASTDSTPAAGPSARSSMSPGPSAATSAMYELQAAATAQGIDPSLAYLDPSLAGPSTPGAFTYTAKFNTRTGTFTRPEGRDPSHLSEYERAKRMSEFYFDVNAWEQEVETRKLEEAHEEETRKRKKPTKKDLERFKEQKRLKKIAKTAWLRT